MIAAAVDGDDGDGDDDDGDGNENAFIVKGDTFTRNEDDEDDDKYTLYLQSTLEVVTMHVDDDVTVITMIVYISSFTAFDSALQLTRCVLTGCQRWGWWNGESNYNIFSSK